MSELRFTADHEWLRLDSDGLVTVGITPFAQEALGDVVFVQLPELQEYAAGDEVAVLESVKAASNIAMPLQGEIVEVNPALEASPELVNSSPLQDGWFFRFRPQDASAVADLLDQAAYDRLLNASDDV
ncbi:MAG: glycine cleavage system protein GcvH [Pseudomonas sp.]|jgi:glycine cleavage system H protein|uniref:glycine cleavage system protein GcvH n=1 Tax=Pseudomonadaceae TaxID=135621 RepID=UPI00028DC34C|nr:MULTISPECIES: glycine cleavage system protein GcvH [Pseudomonadaceae]MBV2206975.1 glycine cleavage system protein GcvH [Pseudomonas sp.]MDT3709672.1 glycine cleavage system protein GcvH [Pseudomonadaceae bacterium]EKM94609.1 glycine cleavage system protein H [Stutzerimonas degradans]EKM97113.1 glycine cleavage system protein H [Stutzerimonas degradans]KGK81539.1 glycine cleavage system protein H [Stutzerimonas degradans]